MAEKKYLTKNYLEKLIKKEKTAFGLSDGIAEKTIYHRVYKYRNNDSYDGSDMSSCARGLKSPLAKIKEVLITMCIQIGCFCQPLKASEGVQLANSLIEKTGVQEQLVKFQKKHTGMTDTNPMLGKVGKGYWQGFNRCHGHRLVSRRGKRFACSRADWSKAIYFKQM